MHTLCCHSAIIQSKGISTKCFRSLPRPTSLYISHCRVFCSELALRSEDMKHCLHHKQQQMGDTRGFIATTLMEQSSPQVPLRLARFASLLLPSLQSHTLTNPSSTTPPRTKPLPSQEHATPARVGKPHALNSTATTFSAHAAAPRALLRTSKHAPSDADALHAQEN